MFSANCPYCGRVNHATCPEVMTDCVYCGRPFAEVRTDYQRLVVLGRDVEGVWEIAENLASCWQEDGDLESEVIVDRRIQAEPHVGGERRRYGSLTAAAAR